MRLFSFEPNRGRPLTSWVDAKGVKHRVDPKTSKVVIAPVFGSDHASRFACFHIGPGGFVPRHPAVGGQLFVVVEGSGWVSGSDGRRLPIRAGQAAYWEDGEAHESGTEKGMRAIVVEGDSFDPSRYMGEIRT
jgi:quercetin dioxygenase-like cupin family protein